MCCRLSPTGYVHGRYLPAIILGSILTRLECSSQWTRHQPSNPCQDPSQVLPAMRREGVGEHQQDDPESCSPTGASHVPPYSPGRATAWGLRDQHGRFPLSPVQATAAAFCSFHFLSRLCHTQPTCVCKKGAHLEAGVPTQQEEAQDRKPRLNAINHPLLPQPGQNNPTLPSV